MAKTTLGKAYVQILPSADGIESKLKETILPPAEKTGKEGGKKLGDSFSAALSSAAKVGAAAIAAIGTAAIAGTTAIIKQTSAIAEYGDNIDKMSQKMGLSATAYQEWDAIMQHSGTSIDSMQAGMKTLANAVENGNEAFQRIGLTQEQIAGMSNEELFAATISGLQNVENETERTYLAGQLLGRGATELGALLNTSAEDTEAMRQRVHELGGVMSDEAVKAAAAYQDSLQDMQTALSGFTRNMVSNFLPSVTTIMDGMTAIFAGDSSGIAKVKQGIQDFAAQISAVLPEFMSIGSEIVLSLGDAIIQNLPVLMQSAAAVILQLSQGIIENLPMILEVALQIVMELALGIADALPELVPTIVDVVLQIVDTLTEPSTLVPLVGAALEIIIALAEGIMEAMPELLAKAPEIILQFNMAILSMIPEVLIAAGKITVAIAEGIWSMIANVWNKGVELVSHFLSAIGSVAKTIFNAGVEIVKNVASGIGSFLQSIYQKGAELVDKVKSAVSDKAAQLLQIGTNIVSGIWNGISNGYEWIKQKISGWVGNVLNWIKKQLGIASPSKVMRDQVGRFMAEGIGVGFANTMDSVRKEMSNAMPGADDLITDADINIGYHIGRPGTRQAQPAQINVYMTVNGERGQDVDTLADKVIRKLGGEIGRLVYA